MSTPSYRSLAILISFLSVPLHLANAAPAFSSLGGSITGKIAVISNSDGTLQAFARGTDNALWTIAQISPDGSWGTWQNLGGVLSSSPAVGMNGLGLLEVFVLGSDSSLWKISQFTKDGPFTGWQGLGGTLSGDPAVTTDANGNLHVFATGSDHAVWTIAESSPGGSYGGWVSLEGYVLHSPAAVTNTNGSVEVFAIGGDTAVWHNWTVDASFDWNGWATLGGSIAGSPSAIILAGFVWVGGTGTDNALWVLQHEPGRDWFPIASLGGSLTSDPALAVGANATYWAFVRGTDNGVWSRSGFDSGWFNWVTEGGTSANGPSAVVNPLSGRMSVFIEGPDTALYTAEQSQFGPVWQ